MNPLKKIIPYLDKIMVRFYEDLLSHRHMSDFFENEAHIQRLIQKQKKSFKDSLEDSAQALYERYRRMGVFHYDIKVPAVDFLRSTQIFRTNFIDFTIRELNDINLIRNIDTYFRTADVAMCQGYLERQISIDKRDLMKLIRHYERPDSMKGQVGLSHLKWLLQILEAIEKKDTAMLSDLEYSGCKAHVFLSDQSYISEVPFSNEHLDDLHQRIHIDAKNLFYFIEKKDFPEVLALYSNLLSAYKITLVLLGNHALNLELVKTQTELRKANETIRELEEIIPICSYCHKIRDDKGAWNRLEAYFSGRIKSKFSHGICPKCLKEIEETDNGW